MKSPSCQEHQPAPAYRGAVAPASGAGGRFNLNQGFSPQAPDSPQVHPGSHGIGSRYLVRRPRLEPGLGLGLQWEARAQAHCSQPSLCLDFLWVNSSVQSLSPHSYCKQQTWVWSEIFPWPGPCQVESNSTIYSANAYLLKHFCVCLA